MSRLWQDVRWAVLGMRRAPLFSAIVVLTLALGIGANTAMFSVIRTVMLQPLPYGQPERVALIWNPASLSETTWLSRQEVVHYGLDAQTFEAVGAYSEADATLTGGSEPERIRAAAVTVDMFSVLQVSPLLGRPFLADDGIAGAGDVVVLSHGLWQRRFGGRDDVIGRAIHVNGTPRTIVGVMPQSFMLPLDYRQERPTEIWLPLVVDAANLGQWGNRGLIGVGRLRHGVEPSDASAELDVIGQRWIAAGHIADQGDGPPRRAAIPVRHFLTDTLRAPLAILLGTVVFVLLIALANVANLLLARAGSCGRDLAIRAALGAPRTRLVSEMLIESVVLAVCGGALGLGLAKGLVRLLATMHSGTLPRIEDAAIDPAVLLFAAGISLAAGVLFGLMPALELTGPSLHGLLQEAGRGATPGRRRLRLRHGFVVVQMTLSVVLVLGAGLLTRSLVALNGIDLGFDTSNVLSAQLHLPATSYAEPGDVIRFYAQLEERLQQAPGVRQAGAARILPLSRTIGDWSITIEGRAFSPAENPNADFQWATPGYFAAMGIRPLHGRVLTRADTEDGAMVAVINETMARRYWPGEDAIGKRFHLGTLDQPWLTIVGILPTVRHNAVVEEPRAEMYLSHAQVARERAGTPRSMAIVVKTSSDPRGTIGALRETVRGLDPNLPLSDVRTMEEVAAKALAEPRLTTWLLGGFALLALALAAIGIYGAMSLLVAERTHEIGIRLALGAERRTILTMVLARAGSLAAAGTAIGVTTAVLLTRFLESLLYGVTPLDPMTFVSVPVVLGVVALLASLAPGVRAATLDPVRTLKR